MENDEFISFGQRLADFFKGRSAAKHWGGGGVPARPREPNSDSFPYQLGARDAFEAARTAAEQKLMVSPGWDLPRWRKQNSFAATIHADPVRENWFNLQFVIEPRNVTRAAIIEYGDFIGRSIILAQNPKQNAAFDPLPGSEFAVTVLENDFRSFRADQPYGKEKVYDLIAIF
jgi:hypothetical protein